jgi:glycosyltransferase involved in cell wall biosynthesis
VPAGVPVVWHVHDFYGARRAAGWLLRRARSRVRAAVAVSHAVAADARRVLPGVRVEVVPNAVDVEHFSPGPGDGESLDRRAGLPPAPPGTVRVGLVAAYARWKGQLAVLDAAATLAREAPALPVRWYLVGGPIYHTAAQFTEAELRAAAEARGLAGRVGFVPFAADPAPVYRALDVVLHASTQPEPFGLTVAEAMACGRAVVVSAAGGAAELFTDGRNALGVPPGDVARLANAVRLLVENPEVRVRLGRAARYTAVERFDANHYGPRLCRVYRDATARAAR